MSPPSPDQSSAASLYCCEDAGDVVSWNADTWISGQSPPSDETTIATLIDRETHHMPSTDYLRRCRHRSIDFAARQDSINWILKVHAYYRFRPVTALLSVNYFDRFLSSHYLPQSNGSWPFQLLSVACLSLAAKMEELYVPLLSDLQIFEPKFLFESKTVQKMELWVMNKLNWRLSSVTPFDYLNYFISKLPNSSTSESEFLNRVFSASSDLILSTTHVTDFLDFTPSAIAAAATLCSVGENKDFPASDDGSLVFFHERVNKEMVRSCLQLMKEYLIDTCRVAEPPVSPVGVLDAAATCGSCDTRSENPGSRGRAEPPPAKRARSSAPDVQKP